MTTTFTAFTIEVPAHMIALGDIIIGDTEVNPGHHMFTFDKVVKVEAISHEDVEINDRITTSRSNKLRVVRSSDESQSAENFRSLFDRPASPLENVTTPNTLTPFDHEWTELGGPGFDLDQ